MFAAENEAESGRFLEFLAALLRDPPEGVDPYALITVRADSVESLLQRWPALGLDTPRSLYLPPLSPAAYRDVILKPAAVYSERVRRLAVEPALADALVRDAVGADALPLLAFTLEKLFFEFGAAAELTLERYLAMGGVGGSIGARSRQPNATPVGEAQTICAASSCRASPPGTRRRARPSGRRQRGRADGGERKALAPLANALVEARLLTRNRDTLEVAHEALLRVLPISDWLEDRKDALKLRDDALKEAGEWAGEGKAAKDLVRRGERLKTALGLLADPDFAAALAPAKHYLAACEKAEKAAKSRARRIQAVSYALLVGVILSLVGFIEKDPLMEQWHWLAVVRPYINANIAPYVLSDEAERALKPGQTFRECAKNCPEMVVIPAGTFVMGSPDGQAPVIGLDGKPKPGPLAAAEKRRLPDEGPQHEVKIGHAFAAGKYAVTFDEWDECAKLGACPQAPDSGYGRGRNPVINVSWDEAKKYVDWLSLMTEKKYRLLSEAEWEYSARAGTSTAYSFGDNYPPSKKICEYANFADAALGRAAKPRA